MSTSPTMPMRALAPWFGAKRTLASRIIAQLGPHRSYWEPACGAMSVLLVKPPTSMETVNDLHGDLTNLARVVAGNAAFGLYDRLQRTITDESLYTEATGRMREPFAGDGPDPERAYWYFVASWMGRSGNAGLRRTDWQMAVRWTSNGGSGAGRFRAAVDSLPAWHQRLRNVQILRRDLFDVLPRIEDQPRTAIYVDPPYTFGSGRVGASKYRHEFAPDDHARLAIELRRFRLTRVLVSYYDDPAIDELYAGWTKLRLQANKNLHVQNRRGAEKVEAPEVLLINGPPLAASIFAEPETELEAGQ